MVLDTFHSDYPDRAKCAQVIAQLVNTGIGGSAALGFVAMLMPYDFIWMSYTDIAEDLGISRRRAIAVVRDLRIAGIIEVYVYPDKRDLSSNAYRLASFPVTRNANLLPKPCGIIPAPIDDDKETRA